MDSIDHLRNWAHLCALECTIHQSTQEDSPKSVFMGNPRSGGDIQPLACLPCPVLIFCTVSSPESPFLLDIEVYRVLEVCYPARV